MIFEFNNKTFEAVENPNGSLTFLDVDVSSMKLSSLLELPWSNYSWSVKENFNCNYNQLISLVGCPTSIGGGFYCSYNKLTSLVGCLTSVGGGFYCSYNKLTSLVGCLTSVGGNFYCRDNKLTSLIGCPTSVGRDFNCCFNQLTSLVGSPTSIKGKFYSDNFSHEDYLSYIMKTKVNQLQSL